MTTPNAQHTPGAPGARPVWWLLTAGLVATVGLIAAVVWAGVVVVGALGGPDHFTRVGIPGTTTLDLRRGDRLVVYYEGTCGGTGTQTPALTDLGVQVTAPDGSAVELRRYAGTQRYDHAGGVGTAVGTVRADASGRYRITTTGPGGAGGVLAVGPSIMRTAVTGLLGPGAVAVAVVVLALIIAVAPFTRPRSTEPAS